MTGTALFVSPHLDDVVFSCGGTLADLADRGWRTCMTTVFTASILPPTGFALDCQLDKGLAPEIDYMALRRQEDRDAAALLGVTDLRWLDLPEAPHRGYASAPELFADIREDDAVWRLAAQVLHTIIGELGPAQIFAPQGLGSHVDHRQVIRAVQAVAGGVPIAWYRDTPYAIRNPRAAPYVDAQDAGARPIDQVLDRKIRAACAYRSQIGFQFGGVEQTAAALTAFTKAEGGERFSGMFNKALPKP